MYATLAAAAPQHIIIFTAVVRDAEGRASSALTAPDFVVREGTYARPIALFRNLRPPQELILKRPPEEYSISNRPLAAFGSQQPVNVLILDTRNTDPVFQPWMRSQTLRFISMLRPDTDVAFYQLASSGLKLLHEFSHDKAQLSSAVADVLEPATAGEFERESSASALQIDRYRKTCEAISAMAEHLSHFENRKNLLWISGDFPPLFESKDRPIGAGSSACPATALALNRSNTSLYPVDVRSPIANEPFQPVAPGDLQTVPRNRRQVLSREWLNTMASLAALTGGRAIENRSQLAEAMIDAVTGTRFAYELGFTIPESECDAGLHALSVQVTMRDATVLAKQAFVADCGAKQTDEASLAPFDSPAIGLSAMPSIQAGVELPVQLKVLIAPVDLQWTKTGDKWVSSVEITVRETMSEGIPRLLASRTLPLSSADGKREPPVALLAVKPDRDAQTLRVTVRDKASERQGSVTVPLKTLLETKHKTSETQNQ